MTVGVIVCVIVCGSFCVFLWFSLCLSECTGEEDDSVVYDLWYVVRGAGHTKAKNRTRQKDERKLGWKNKLDFVTFHSLVTRSACTNHGYKEGSTHHLPNSYRKLLCMVMDEVCGWLARNMSNKILCVKTAGDNCCERPANDQPTRGL